MMAWAFNDEPAVVWTPDQAFPQRVIDHVKAGGEIRAWNAQFERLIWWYVLGPDHQLPEPKLEQFKCSAARARAHGLPGSLKDTGRALALEMQKQDSGQRLIKLYCVPGHKTEIPPDDWALFLDYCRMDVEVERHIGSFLRELTDTEWQDYWANERINDRGVPVDVAFARAAQAYGEDIKREADGKIRELTQGEVPNARSRKKRDEWLRPRLDAHHLETLLENKVLKFGKPRREELLQIKDIKPEVRRFTELVDEAGGATLGKYKALADRTMDGRLCGAFMFSGGGQTGRYSSTGIQLHNLRRDVFDNPDELITQIMRGDEIAEPTLALSRLVRAAISRPEGLAWVDYSNIEGRMAPWLEGTQLGEDKLDVFRKGVDPYKVNAAQTFGVAYEDVTKEQRQAGKVQELACIAEDSLVLTLCGEKRIQDVVSGDFVWDGVSWVHTDGAIYKGERNVIEYQGLCATDDHLVWVESCEDPIPFGVAASSGSRLVQSSSGGAAIRVHSHRDGRTQVHQGMVRLVCSDEMLGLRAPEMDKLHLHDQREGQRVPELQQPETSPGMALQTANRSEKQVHKPERRGVADLWGQRQRVSFFIGDRSCGLGDRESGDTRQVDGNRPNQKRGALRTGEPALVNIKAKPPAHNKNGKHTRISQFSTRTPSRSLRGQHAEKSDFYGFDVRSDRGTVEPPKLQTKRRVWDLLNCGPLHRFTASGKLVHNCQFGGGVGALQSMAANFDLEISDDYGKILRDGWRAANPWMASFGRKLEKAVTRAVKTPQVWHEAGRVAYAYDGTDWLWCKLPSGRLLAYFAPRFEDVVTPWGEPATVVTALWGGAKPKAGEPWPRRPLVGGLLIENCTQAASACLLRDAIRQCDAKGIEVVMHVHDELVAQNCDKNDLRDVLLNAPAWSVGLPIQASAESGVRYGK
jgi:DNA polymerase